MKTFLNFLLEQKMIRVIMIGGPGSGKSTYSEIISKKLDIPHIYTGDMMRKLAQQDTPDGRKVKELLSKGEFAPTDIVIKAVKERLQKDDAKSGYIFDGFPGSPVICLGNLGARQDFNHAVICIGLAAATVHTPEEDAKDANVGAVCVLVTLTDGQGDLEP